MNSEILEKLKELTPIDLEETCLSSLEYRYGGSCLEGWVDLDSVYMQIEMDPIGWKGTQSKWVSEQCEGEFIISFDNGNTYYWSHDVEALV